VSHIREIKLQSEKELRLSIATEFCTLSSLVFLCDENARHHGKNASKKIGFAGLRRVRQPLENSKNATTTVPMLRLRHSDVSFMDYVHDRIEKIN